MNQVISYIPSNHPIHEIKICTNYRQANKSHLHNEYSFGFVEFGTSSLSVGEQIYQIKAGDIVMIAPDMSHLCVPDDIDNWSFTMLYADRDYVEQWILEEENGYLPLFSSLTGERAAAYRHIFDIFKTKEPKSKIEAGEMAIFLALVKAFIRHDEAKSSEEVFLKVGQYLSNHFLEEMTLAQLEIEFQLNQYTLIRKFKRHFNATPKAYVLQLKLNYSKHLLGIGGELSKIAVDSGFYDQAHFTREFKKAYGMTPKVFLNQVNSVQ